MLIQKNINKDDDIYKQESQKQNHLTSLLAVLWGSSTSLGRCKGGVGGVSPLILPLRIHPFEHNYLKMFSKELVSHFCKKTLKNLKSLLCIIFKKNSIPNFYRFSVNMATALVINKIFNLHPLTTPHTLKLQATSYNY